ncbi:MULTISPECIES: hypothetical protein [unclassified Streptomyces]|uniref:hypothetical protein n=1 Tax=unclassified Streptomyces TaxID=2593676 RepID=UPI002237E9D9|nr:hypothetical protein [Streptomyces sp. SHP 1-2]MCW5251428.1 hypothetical protein [Streptomyces sp. SHP 1-2]
MTEQPRHGRRDVIKVNQVCGVREARWVRGADILGVCLGDGGRTVTAEGFREIRRAVSAPLALSVDASAGVSDADLPGLVRSLGPDYYEFTPPDPEKAEAFEARLALVRRVGLPGIANGFFLLEDEVSLVRSAPHLDRLAAAGVRYFQVEADSLLGPRGTISAGSRRLAADLFGRYPFLVNDRFGHLDSPLDVQQSGLYLNIGGRGVRNYDLSERSYALPAAVRLLRSAGR